MVLERFELQNDKSLICIQASTNKGNSGGALVNNKVKSLVLLFERRRNICPTWRLFKDNESEAQGSIQLMGVDLTSNERNYYNFE
jgi:hypothetical protein